MKKRIAIILIACLFVLSLACAETQPAQSGKILIAYFSKTGENYGVGVISEGNTAKVAKEIAAQTGGELFEIRKTESYPDGYDETLETAKKEQDAKARPALAESIDISGYDTIYIGAPVWWGEPPMAVYSFLESQDFSGKTVLPFNTHEGSGESGFQNIFRNALPDAVVKEVLSIQGTTAQNDAAELTKRVSEWLEKTK